jgi:PAS domain-containing protein
MLKTNREYAPAGFNRQDEANEAVSANALRWLEKMLAASRDPAYFFDMKSRRLLAVNRLLVKLLGYRWEELLEKSVEDLRPIEELPHLLRSLRQEPPSNSVDCRHIRKTGRCCSSVSSTATTTTWTAKEASTRFAWSRLFRRTPRR